jgi:hypothetical protein
MHILDLPLQYSIFDLMARYGADVNHMNYINSNSGRNPEHNRFKYFNIK